MALTETTQTTTEPSAAASSPSIFALHDFRLLLAAQILAGFRGPMLWFAQAWYINTAAPEDRRVLLLGVLASVNGLAFLSWALFGGALADRYPRRTTLMASHAVAAIVVGVTAATLWIPGVEGGGRWLILVLPLFAMFGLINAQDLPARTALVADVVPGTMLTAAITANWMAFALVMLVANYLGGVLIETLGFGGTYALGVLPHLVIVGLLWKLKLRAGPADTSAAGRSLLANVQEGVRYLREDRAVRWTVLLMWTSVFGGANVMWILGAAWMRDVMGVGPAGWSALTLFWSGGMIVSSALLMARGQYRGKGLLFVSAGVLYAIAVVTYAFSRSVLLTGLAMGFAGLAFQTQQTVGTAILQTVVPRHLLGRVTALLFLAQGLAQTSGLAFGLLGQALGLELLFPIVGFAMLAVALAVALLQHPLRALD